MGMEYKYLKIKHNLCWIINGNLLINNKIYYEKQKIIYNKKIIKWEKLEKNLYHENAINET